MKKNIIIALSFLTLLGNCASFADYFQIERCLKQVEALEGKDELTQEQKLDYAKTLDSCMRTKQQS